MGEAGAFLMKDRLSSLCAGALMKEPNETNQCLEERQKGQAVG